MIATQSGWTTRAFRPLRWFERMTPSDEVSYGFDWFANGPVANMRPRFWIASITGMGFNFNARRPVAEAEWTWPVDSSLIGQTVPTDREQPFTFWRAVE